MRLSRFSLLAALLLGAVGCKEADLAPVVAKIPPLAFVRYINAVPDTLNTTVRWIDKVEFTPQTFTNVPFRGDVLKTLCASASGSNPVTGRDTRDTLDCG